MQEKHSLTQQNTSDLNASTSTHHPTDEQTKTIKIYDLDAFLRAEAQMEAFRYKRVAVFEGKRGVVVAEEEAVHQRVNSLTDTIEIPANEPPDPGKVWIIANYLCTISVDEIMKSPYKEQTMSDFFNRRDRNPRCQSNFKTLIHSLRAIDFDMTGFFPVKKPLSQQLKSASSRTSTLPGSDHTSSKDTERSQV